MSVQQEKFKVIADKIREKTGDGELIKPDDFAEKVDEVYDAGKKSQYDEFWDSFQQNGKRTLYDTAFCGSGFNETTFKPKYDIIMKGGAYMPFARIAVKSLKKIEEENNIKIDFSGLASAEYLFHFSNIEEVGIVDLSNVTSPFYTTFMHSTNLKTIDLLVLNKNASQTFKTGCFEGCKKLEEIKIQGKIGDNFDIHSSTVLSYESLMSIITALIETQNLLTFTIGQRNIDKLSDEDIAIVNNKGWTIA